MGRTIIVGNHYGGKEGDLAFNINITN